MDWFRRFCGRAAVLQRLVFVFLSFIPISLDSRASTDVSAITSSKVFLQAAKRRIVDAIHHSSKQCCKRHFIAKVLALVFEVNQIKILLHSLPVPSCYSYDFWRPIPIDRSNQF